ncbi:MAG: DUF2752 domain-containing protein [Ilumatobacter sp.]
MTFADASPHGPGTPGHRGLSPGALLTWVISSPLRVGVVAAAAVLAVDAGGSDDGAGVCLFRRSSGGYCPGCGLTRSARHLTRGEVALAWQDHPWLLLVTLQVAVAGLFYAVFERTRVHVRRPRNLAILASLNGVLLLTIWAIRLVDGSIPRFF